MTIKWRLNGKMIQYKDSSEWNDLCEYRKYDEVDFDTVEENAEVTESVESVKVDDHLWQVKYSGDTSLELEGEREALYIPFKESLEPRIVLDVYDENGDFVADFDESRVEELSDNLLGVSGLEYNITSVEKRGWNKAYAYNPLLYSISIVIGIYFLLTSIIPSDGLVSLYSILLLVLIMVAALFLFLSVPPLIIEFRRRDDIASTEEFCRIH